MTPNAVGVGHGVRARGEPGWVFDEHLRVHPVASPGEGGGGQRMAGALLNARLARVEHARRCGRLPRNHRLVPGFRGSSSRLTTQLPAWEPPSESALDYGGVHGIELSEEVGGRREKEQGIMKVRKQERAVT